MTTAPTDMKLDPGTLEKLMPLTFLAGWATADKDHLSALPEALVRGLNARYARVQILGFDNAVVQEHSFPAGEAAGRMHLADASTLCVAEFSRPLGSQYMLTLVLDACPGTLTAFQHRAFELVAQQVHGALQCLYVDQHQRQALGTPFHQFSDKEWNVCERLAGPESEKAIASDIGSSPHTVHCHVKSVYKKLLVQSRLEVIHQLRAARARFRRGSIFNAVWGKKVDPTAASGQDPVRASA